MAKRGGVTLVEVLVASILSGMIVFALGTAFALTLNHERNFGEPRRRFEQSNVFEDQIHGLLTRAVLMEDGGDSTFFVGESTSGDASLSDQLSFTVAGTRTASTALANNESDFSERNRTLGPMGGVTEYGLSMTAVGDAGNIQGLFIRRQTPSDSDHLSGGYESVLSREVATLQFEFWDATAWVATWDSREEGRLPEAVRINYSLTSDPDVQRTMIVRLPNAQGAPVQ